MTARVGVPDSETRLRVADRVTVGVGVRDGDQKSDAVEVRVTVRVTVGEVVCP